MKKYKIPRLRQAKQKPKNTVKTGETKDFRFYANKKTTYFVKKRKTRKKN